MTVPRRSDTQARIAWLRENLGKLDAKTRRAAEQTIDDLTSLVAAQRSEIDSLAARAHGLETQLVEAQSPKPAPGQTQPAQPAAAQIGGTLIGGTSPGGTPPAQQPGVAPLDLAQSFRQVVDSVQAEARAAPGGATTIQSLNVEVKGLVQVDASGKTSLVLPQTGAGVDPQALSTLHISFAAIPGAVAPPPPAAGQAQSQQGGATGAGPRRAGGR